MRESLSRRALLGRCAATALSHRISAQQGRRPNILWISSEDTGTHLRCYGDKRAITPNLDRLASQGVRYLRAYSVAGVCAPSRSAIITGMYPTTLGTMHMRCDARLPANVRCFPEYLRRAGYYCTNNSKTDYNFQASPETWDESSAKAHWRNRRQGQPFFAVFNITVSHESRIPPRGDEFGKISSRLAPSDRQDPKKLRIPPYHPDTEEARRDWANYYEVVTAMDYEAGDRLRELAADGLAEDTIVFYWGDHGDGLPRDKRWLYETSVHVPLIVRVPEKFRAYGQSHPGKVSRELVSLIDLAPTVLNLASVPLPPQFQGRAFLGENLKSPRQYVYGVRDRMDERYDTIRAVRDRRFRYIRNYETWKPYCQFMSTAEGGPTMQELRRLQAAQALPKEAELFMGATKPAEELYDAENDPYEVKNLAGNSRFRGVLERLRKVHEDWQDETGDLGLIPEPELEAREEALGSRTAILRQPGLAELPRRLRQAARLVEQGEAAALKLREALKEREPAIRYWAATGIGNLAGRASAFVDELRRAAEDESAAVRVAAARGLLRMGLASEAEPVLLAALAHKHQSVRLQAVIALDEAGYKPARVKAALEPLLGAKDRNYVARVARHLYDGGRL